MSRSISHEQQRALWISLAANGVFMVAELIGGLMFNSLALLADAAHMVSDVAALGIALVAQRLLLRPASLRHTYGLQRAEVLGAQVNGLLLLVAAGWIFYEAVERIATPTDVTGGGLVAVATLGLVINVGSALLLARVQGKSLNMHGAFLHMVTDSVASLGVITAGVAIVAWDARWVDAVASIGIGILVLWSAWRLLRAATHVLLEGTPRGTDFKDVERALAAAEGVEAVHHLHIWNLSSEVPALSAHIVLDGEMSLHDAQERAESLKSMLGERFGIGHATLELECHSCEPEAAKIRDRVTYARETRVGHR